jgi:hypothetical protein
LGGTSTTLHSFVHCLFNSFINNNFCALVGAESSANQYTSYARRNDKHYNGRRKYH